jgi:hypothetical protein
MGQARRVGHERDQLSMEMGREYAEVVRTRRNGEAAADSIFLRLFRLLRPTQKTVRSFEETSSIKQDGTCSRVCGGQMAKNRVRFAAIVASSHFAGPTIARMASY